MKIIMKEILVIGLIQFIAGWLVTKFIVRQDWDVVKFVTSPGIITFWVAYVVIEFAVACIRRNREKTKP